eukprot:GGOE01020313.1.p1 GENE.GGOE01020313.1~~GGOE01020313.1.p1  ORF type:complete len:281 (-),score=55.88 GGOE01020313.1:191-958(-)
MAGQDLSLLLQAVLSLLVISFCCSAVATTTVDWSKSPINHYGLWSVCNSNGPDVCIRRRASGLADFQTCESLLALTQGLSLLSVVALGGAVGCAVLLVAKWRAPSSTAAALRQLTHILMAADGALLLCAGIYLGVDAEGQCIFQDFGTHQGSSWFLHLCSLVLSAGATLLAIAPQSERGQWALSSKSAQPSKVALSGGPKGSVGQKMRLWWRRLRRRLSPRGWWAKLRSSTSRFRFSSSSTPRAASWRSKAAPHQ